jgi:RNA polymerase sigma-32 factor
MACRCRADLRRQHRPDAGRQEIRADRGFRLATYAMWWIKASMQEFILRSWSLVKMGTTAAQKKLFFNLRRMKKNIDALKTPTFIPTM